MVFNKTRAVARILGNFGVGFFGPLLASNVAISVFHSGLHFNETLIVAALASSFQTGLALSKEIQSYGETRK